jgi:hypothetical protein
MDAAGRIQADGDSGSHVEADRKQQWGHRSETFPLRTRNRDKFQGDNQDHQPNGIGVWGHIGHRCLAVPTAQDDRLVAGPLLPQAENDLRRNRKTLEKS